MIDWDNETLSLKKPHRLVFINFVIVLRSTKTGEVIRHKQDNWRMEIENIAGDCIWDSEIRGGEKWPDVLVQIAMKHTEEWQWKTVKTEEWTPHIKASAKHQGRPSQF